MVNQKVASLLLRRLGYAVSMASNGQVAVDAMQERRFDAILMDCQMPVMDGYLATHALRAGESEGGRALTIVAMTANAMAGDRERCLEAGMDDYLVKPVLRDALVVEERGPRGPVVLGLPQPTRAGAQEEVLRLRVDDGQRGDTATHQRRPDLAILESGESR